MTLVNLGSFSGITDGANASPSYLNSKFSQLLSMVTAVNSAGTDFGAVASGSTTTFPVGVAFVLQSFDSGGAYVNARNYCNGNGSTDDAANLRSLFSVAAGKTVYFPAGNYRVESTVTISSALKIFMGGGQGTASFYKATSGDMFHVANANVEFHNVALDADTAGTSAGSAGWGIRVTGGANIGNFKFLGGAINSMVSGIVFDDDTGAGSMIANCRIAPYTAVTAGEGVGIQAGNDTSARQRFISNVNMPGGYVSLGSTNDTFITNCSLKRVHMVTATCFGTHVQGCRLGNSGSTMTMDGNSSFYVGNALSGTMVINATCSGVYVGNGNSSGSVINNSTQANFLLVDPYHFRMASGGSFNLNTSRFLSMRTLAATSLNSANLQPFEMAIAYGASGCSLAFRSGGTVWYPNSSLSTVG